jgi:hypothetical protein
MRHRLISIVGACLIAPASARAQYSEQEPGPTLVRGAFSLESSLGIEALYDDNIFESSPERKSSAIWKLRPNLLMQFEPARSRLEFGYDGDYARYDDSGDDDYTDHDLTAGAYLLLGERNGLDLEASYEYGHDNRGTVLTQGADPGSPTLPRDPDRYTSEEYLGRYTYGVSRTRAFLIFEGATQQFNYTNNEARTRAFDRKSRYGQGTFGVRIRPSVSLQLSARARDIEYDHPRASGLDPDSREYRYLLGAQWEATARTTGSARFGRVEKKFDEPGRPDFSAPNWEVAIRWSPRTYSHFDLSTERYTDEPIDLPGDVIDIEIYSLSWSHEWNSRLGSRTTISRLDRTYRYSTGDRSDQSPRYGLALNYRMRPWLRWELGFDVSSRDGDVARQDYDKTIARLGAWITF